MNHVRFLFTSFILISSIGTALAKKKDSNLVWKKVESEAEIFRNTLNSELKIVFGSVESKGKERRPICRYISPEGKVFVGKWVGRNQHPRCNLPSVGNEFKQGFHWVEPANAHVEILYSKKANSYRWVPVSYLKHFKRRSIFNASNSRDKLIFICRGNAVDNLEMKIEIDDHAEEMEQLEDQEFMKEMKGVLAVDRLMNGSSFSFHSGKTSSASNKKVKFFHKLMDISRFAKAYRRVDFSSCYYEYNSKTRRIRNPESKDQDHEVYDAFSVLVEVK